MLSLPPNVHGQTRGYLYIKIQLISLPTRLPKLRLKFWGDLSSGFMLRPGKRKVYSTCLEIRCSLLQFSRYLCDMIPLKIELIDENMEANGFVEIDDLKKLSKSCPVNNQYPIESKAEYSLGKLNASIWIEDAKERHFSLSSLSTTDQPLEDPPKAQKMESVLQKEDSSFRSLATPNCSDVDSAVINKSTQHNVDRNLKNKPENKNNKFEKINKLENKNNKFEKINKPENKNNKFEKINKPENKKNKFEKINNNLITNLLKKTQFLIKEADDHSLPLNLPTPQTSQNPGGSTITTKIYNLLIDQVNSEFSEDQILMADNLFCNNFSEDSLSSEDPIPTRVEAKLQKNFTFELHKLRLALNNCQNQFLTAKKPPLQESQYSVILRFLNTTGPDVVVDSAVNDGAGTEFAVPAPFLVSSNKPLVEVIILLYCKIGTKKKCAGLSTLNIPWDIPRSIKTTIKIIKSREDCRVLGNFYIEMATKHEEIVKRAKPMMVDNSRREKMNPEKCYLDLPPLYTLLMISEGSNIGISLNTRNDSFRRARNPYIRSKMFWIDDVMQSNVFFNSANPHFSFCQVTPMAANCSDCEKMKNNFLIIEVWDRRTFEAEDKLIGIVRVPLHPMATALLNGDENFWETELHTIVDNWLPVRNPLRGTDLGSLYVFFALGIKRHLDVCIERRVVPKIERCVSQEGQRKTAVPQRSSPRAEREGGLIKHVMRVEFHSLENFNFLAENSDIFIQYKFPRQLGQNIELALFKTSFCSIQSLKDFSDSHSHSICLDSTASFTKALLGVFEANECCRFEIWSRNYVPAIRDRLVATANLDLCKLISIPATFDETGMTAVTKHHFRLAMEMTNLSAFSQTRFDCFLHLVVSYERLMASEKIEDAEESLLVDVKLNNFAIEMSNELFFRILSPNRINHCGRLLTNGKCVPSHVSSMAVSDESSVLKLEIWETPSTSFPTPLEKFEILIAQPNNNFKLRAITDIYLTKLMLKETGINGWFTLFGASSDFPIGAVNISIRYTKEGQRQKSLRKSAQLPNLWPIEAKNHKITFKFVSAHIELHKNLRPHFGTVQYLYFRTKFYQNETDCTNPVVVQRSGRDIWSAEIDQSLIYETKLSPNYCWFTREESVEIEIWMISSCNQGIFPAQSDFFVGSFYIDLIDLFVEDPNNYARKNNNFEIYKAANVEDCALQNSYIKCRVESEFINKICPPSIAKPQISTDCLLFHLIIERGSNLKLIDPSKNTPKFHVILPSQGQTSTVTSANPVWNFEMDIQIPKSSLKRDNYLLQFDVVYSDDDSHSRIIGNAHVDLKPLLVGMPELYGWYNVTDSLRDCKGQIKLAIVPLYLPINEDKFCSDSRISLMDQGRTENFVGKNDENLVEFEKYDVSVSTPSEISSLTDLNVDDHVSILTLENSLVESAEMDVRGDSLIEERTSKFVVDSVRGYSKYEVKPVEELSITESTAEIIVDNARFDEFLAENDDATLITDEGLKNKEDELDIRNLEDVAQEKTENVILQPKYQNEEHLAKMDDDEKSIQENERELIKQRKPEECPLDNLTTELNRDQEPKEFPFEGLSDLIKDRKEAKECPPLENLTDLIKDRKEAKECQRENLTTEFIKDQESEEFPFENLTTELVKDQKSMENSLNNLASDGTEQKNEGNVLENDRILSDDNSTLTIGESGDESTQEDAEDTLSKVTNESDTKEIESQNGDPSASSTKSSKINHRECSTGDDTSLFCSDSEDKEVAPTCKEDKVSDEERMNKAHDLAKNNFMCDALDPEDEDGINFFMPPSELAKTMKSLVERVGRPVGEKTNQHSLFAINIFNNPDIHRIKRIFHSNK